MARRAQIGSYAEYGLLLLHFYRQAFWNYLTGPCKMPGIFAGLQHAPPSATDEAQMPAPDIN